MIFPDNLFFSIDETLSERKILIRIDINTTLSEKGDPVDTARIDAALSVLKELSGRGAKVVALAHFGEKGESLLPLALFLQERIPNLTFLPGTNRADITSKVNDLKKGEILLLENVRIFAGETDEEDGLSRFFASLGDVYINDAFPVSHRKHSSVTGIPKHLHSFLGPIMKRELSNLSKALQPEFPCLLVLGGAKLSTKLPLIELYLKKGCFVYVGGAMVHNIIKAKGYEIGESLYDKDYVVSPYTISNEKLLIPVDVVLDDKRVVPLKAIPKDRKVFDCGPKTITTLKEVITKCHTVIMNGPVGYYEGGFKDGTENILRAIEKGAALTSIIGGGDTLAVYNAMENKPRLSFVSLGGGAMLDFLKDGTLPGIEAILKSRDQTL